MLRKLMLLGWYVLLAAGLYWLYQNRAIFSPLQEYIVATINHREDQRKIVANMEGRAELVIDSGSFRFRDKDQRVYFIRLAGVRHPTAGPADAALRKKAASELTTILRGQPVRLDCTSLTNMAGLGIAYLGKTNLNAWLLEKGYARIDSAALRGLPTRPRYQFQRAEATARRKTAGVWGRPL